MPRGQYPRKSKEGIVGITTTQALIPVSAFTDAAWWAKLNNEEQTAVQSLGQKLASAMLQYGTSRLAIGEYLAGLQSVLEPYNLFGRFLKNFHFNKRTAYRYIAGYKNAKARLPEVILQQAMVRGVNIVGESELKPLGTYTQAAAKLPPPKEPTMEQANTWLTQVEKVRKEEHATESTAFTMGVPQDPQTLLKEAFRFVSLRYRKLPNNAKARAGWVRSLVSLLLSEFGVTGQQTFMPQTVPDTFKAQRGGARVAAA